jgi:hypothetical protein
MSTNEQRSEDSLRGISDWINAGAADPHVIDMRWALAIAAGRRPATQRSDAVVAAKVADGTRRADAGNDRFGGVVNPYRYSDPMFAVSGAKRTLSCVTQSTPELRTMMRIAAAFSG